MLRSIASVSVIALAACGPTSTKPRVATEAPRPGLCDGLGDDACQERAITQSLCLQAPDEPACEPLRALRLLPPPPPPLASLYGCWQVERPRDDLPTSWICLAADGVAADSGGGWDVWPHAGWHREDAIDRAGWTATLADGRTVWLTVLAATPLALHVTDGSALFATTLVQGDPLLAADEAEQRAKLPSIERVCAAALACIAAVPRPASELDMEVSPDPDAEAIRATHTLRGCADAWRAAATRLEAAVGRERVPATCGSAPPADGDWAWRVELQPPFTLP